MVYSVAMENITEGGFMDPNGTASPPPAAVDPLLQHRLAVKMDRLREQAGEAEASDIPLIEGSIRSTAADGDIAMLRTFEKFLTLDYMPYIIRMALSSLEGGIDFNQQVHPETHQRLRVEHLAACHAIQHALHINTSAKRIPLTIHAVNHPELTDALIEAARRNIKDPKQIIAVAAALSLGAAPALHDGAL